MQVPQGGQATVDAAQAYRDQERRAKTYRQASWALFGLSAAAVAGGVTWLVLSAPEDAPAADGQPALLLVPNRAGLSASAAWRF